MVLKGVGTKSPNKLNRSVIRNSVESAQLYLSRLPAGVCTEVACRLGCSIHNTVFAFSSIFKLGAGRVPRWVVLIIKCVLARRRDATAFR